MLANGSYRGCLRALLARLLDEAHRITNLELVESIAEDAVAVEIDLTSVRSCDEAVVLVGDEPKNAAVGRLLVLLGVTTLAAYIVLELTRGRLEGVTDGDIHVLVGVMSRRLAADNQFATPDGEIDAHMVEHALVVSPVRGFHDHTAGHDVLREAVESSHLLPDVRLNGR